MNQDQLRHRHKGNQAFIATNDEMIVDNLALIAQAERTASRQWCFNHEGVRMGSNMLKRANDHLMEAQAALQHEDTRIVTLLCAEDAPR